MIFKTTIYNLFNEYNIKYITFLIKTKNELNVLKLFLKKYKIPNNINLYESGIYNVPAVFTLNYSYDNIVVVDNQGVYDNNGIDYLLAYHSTGKVLKIDDIINKNEYPEYFI